MTQEGIKILIDIDNKIIAYQYLQTGIEKQHLAAMRKGFRSGVAGFANDVN